MTDPIDLETIARGVAIGAFAATGIAMAASRRLTPARWTGVALFVCAVAHGVESAYGGRHPFTLLWALSVCAPGVLWLFCAVLFEDEPAIPAWRYAAPAACLALWAAAVALRDTPARMPIWQAYALLSAGLVGHILLTAWRGWRSDLVDQRRRLRAPLAAAAAGYMLIQTLCNFGVLGHPPLPPLMQALVMAGLGLGSALAFLRAEPLLMAAPAGPALDTAKPIDTPLDLTPADRLVLARLDKAMNETEVWRGEDLSIGTLAALVGAPEHRLRKLINGTLGHRNFADYVNGRRIEAAKIALADPEQALKSVSTIAYELGFASLGPFNRAFRAAAGVTPTAWRQQATPAHPRLRLIETREGAPKSGKSA
ncbi:AraC family transcriptional regulator [uncultured Caulobacter sp.]|uniref:helix-turn-helix domain-containing protein n=1 Tax=uncultured Caulobacter sp. TaxID=158749 RepID=UPI00261FB08D|nr:AraC family transcriptional regulator [uncultured Caulobacter sp.]